MNGGAGGQIAVALIGSVNTSDIENGAVTEDKMGFKAVSKNKIKDGAVTTDKFAEDAEAPIARKIIVTTTRGADVVCRLTLDQSSGILTFEPELDTD